MIGWPRIIFITLSIHESAATIIGPCLRMIRFKEFLTALIFLPALALASSYTIGEIEPSLPSGWNVQRGLNRDPQGQQFTVESQTGPEGFTINIVPETDTLEIDYYGCLVSTGKLDALMQSDEPSSLKSKLSETDYIYFSPVGASKEKQEGFWRDCLGSFIYNGYGSDDDCPSFYKIPINKVQGSPMELNVIPFKWPSAKEVALPTGVGHEWKNVSVDVYELTLTAHGDNSLVTIKIDYEKEKIRIICNDSAAAVTQGKVNGISATANHSLTFEFNVGPDIHVSVAMGNNEDPKVLFDIASEGIRSENKPIALANPEVKVAVIELSSTMDQVIRGASDQTGRGQPKKRRGERLPEGTESPAKKPKLKTRSNKEK